MNRTLMAYMLAVVVTFSAIIGITMQPIPLNAQISYSTQTQQTTEAQQATEAQQTAPLAISPSCGQVIEQDVILTSNLQCEDSDGLIVGKSSITIDLNGHTISGPDVGEEQKTSSKVGIMVPNVNNIVIKDGTIEGYQACILITGGQDVEIQGITAKDCQIGVFSTGASIVNTHLSTLMNNQIGIAGHSTQSSEINNNIIFKNLLAGITLVNSDNSIITLNSISESGNGIYIDNQSNNNAVQNNNVLNNQIDINNANGLPVNTNENTYDQNNCMTSKPSGICIGK